MSSFSFTADLLKTIVGSTVAGSFIWWWVWIVHAGLVQLRENQITFIGLLGECSRALLTTLIVLTFVTFL